MSYVWHFLWECLGLSFFGVWVTAACRPPIRKRRKTHSTAKTNDAASTKSRDFGPGIDFLPRGENVEPTRKNDGGTAKIVGARDS